MKKKKYHAQLLDQNGYNIIQTWNTTESGQHVELLAMQSRIDSGERNPRSGQIPTRIVTWESYE
jgi:hypothetical protein